MTCENQRLAFQRQNQKALRADTYKNLQEAVAECQQERPAPPDSLYNNENENRVGRYILASSYQCSPRWYNAKFQDAMAIVRKYHKPDLFITMTCNPKWSEIVSELGPGQTPQDRPDLVARVFKQKKDQLIKYLTKNGIFGRSIAHLWVIEFQKRGLPHAHILIVLADEDRPKTPDQVDQIVTAELPPSPLEPGISEEEKIRRQPLWDIVLKHMIHGPCGELNPQSPCMENGKCTKGFPKPFQFSSIVDEETSYPIYRRRSPEQGGQTAKKGNLTIDNRWVVPYSPFLCLCFDCHTNVEICISPLAAKYLYKYVTKGPDRAMVSAEVEDGAQAPRDEIRDYEDMRSVGSSEACWKLLAFPIAENKPPVQVLRLHLENQQHVVFVGGEEEAVVEQGRVTELTAFFEFNAQEKESKGPEFNPAAMPLYVDMPQHYTFREKGWHIWQRGSSIGRVHTVNPLAGDVFYLRMLLHHDHCRGKTSFQDMMTFEGRVCESYQAVCREIGLLSDDQEWALVLTEAAVTKLCSQIRELYVVILRFCFPADPKKLFDDFWADWTDDFKQMGDRRGLNFTEDQLKTMVRLDIQVRLQSHENDLPDFGLPPMTDEEKASVEGLVNTEAAVIREEMDYDVNELAANVETTIPKFTEEQSEIFDTIMRAVQQQESLQVFISARGGCGKSFLLNAILDAVRSLEAGGCLALATATTGIAAQLLHMGRTFHSRLKAPFTPSEDSTLNIPAQSVLADLVRRSRLIVIDEATMLDRLLLEAMDRTLRDLMNKPDTPFGGKIIILAGDFRQCLPVIPGANRAQIVQRCINFSHLWSQFQVFSLTVNMRVRASGDPQLEDFDSWTVGIGDGTANDANGLVAIPENMHFDIKPNTNEDMKVEDRCMKEFCEMVFPNLPANVTSDGWLDGRSLLAPTNKEVDTINDLMESKMPGTAFKLSSSDTLEDYRDVMRFNTEYLNSLCPNGFPRHLLTLKPGIPLMLLRNISPKEGLCNGTKLIFQQILNNKLLVCKLAGSGKTVLIPRIKFISNPGSYPFDWARRQFPVRIAFATTINKSQGQTLKQTGVWLRSPVFSHGQLYVATSRVGNPHALRFAVKKQPEHQQGLTTNEVYHEVLLPQH